MRTVFLQSLSKVDHTENGINQGDEQHRQTEGSYSRSRKGGGLIKVTWGWGNQRIIDEKLTEECQELARSNIF